MKEPTNGDIYLKKPELFIIPEENKEYIKRVKEKAIIISADTIICMDGKVYEKPKSKSRRKVIQCDLNGNKIEEFDSLQSASENTGTSRTSISGCLGGVYKTANGYIWVYKEDYPIKDISVYKKKGKGISVAQLDIDTEEVIATYDSVTEAGKAIGGNYKNIQKILDIPGRTAYGYKWKRT